MSKFSKIAAAFAIVPIVALSGASAFADTPGQLTGGSNLYEVKDLTTNSAYAKTISPACNDEIEYSMLVNNGGYGDLSSVNLTATLPSTGGTSTATATTNLGGATGASDSVNVTLPSNATQTLVDGSTVLYDGSGAAISTLPDTITTSGVNIGSLEGSTYEFVNFKADISCASTPATPVYTCDELTVSTTADDKTVSLGALNTTATNGAAFSYATINWGDNSTPTSAADVSGQTHTYATAGTYTITATAYFNVNGGHNNETATSDACTQKVTFASPTTTTTPPTTTTAKPTQLVNTGAGDTIGIFAAVSAVSAVAYRLVIARRLSRQ